jgi:hypothetical protein
LLVHNDEPFKIEPMQYRLFFYRPILFLAVALFSTQFAAGQNTIIPAAWQKGMTLSMSYSGGMRYYSYELEIKDSGSYMQVNNEGRISYYKLQLKRKDLDSLIAFLHKNKFSEIESVMTGPTSDKGTESMLLSWDNQFAGAGESYASAIAAKDRAHYLEIRNYIWKLAERTRKKVKALPPSKSEIPGYL